MRNSSSVHVNVCIASLRLDLLCDNNIGFGLLIYLDGWKHTLAIECLTMILCMHGCWHNQGDLCDRSARWWDSKVKEKIV